MAYTAGDKKVIHFNIPIRDILDAAQVVSVTSGSISAMTVAAKKIIERMAANTVISAGNPIVFFAFTAASIAGVICTHILDQKLGDTNTIRLYLYLEYDVKKVHKQGAVWNVGQWNVEDFSFKVL